jgi:hypothetical protein
MSTLVITKGIDRRKIAQLMELKNIAGDGFGV